MSDSVPLYVDDSHIREFDARVVRSGPRFVVLDVTAFYPEGGGQPSDTGTLEAGGETFKVLKVMKRGTQIFHYLDGDLPEGSEVRGVVDWDRRLTHMRLHSGEHLLTGLFEAEGGGPKVFSSFTQLDFQPSGIDEETLKRVRERFDSIIKENIPVTIYYTSRDELDVGDDTRKQSFLEKMPPGVHELRMVQIGGHALTFCMGTHVRSTGEIGKLKSLRLEPKKKQRKIVYFELDNVKRALPPYFTGARMRIKPFRLERWLLEKAEIDLGGGGVTKLKLVDVVPDFDLSQTMKYGSTDGSDELKGLVAEWYAVEPENVLITSGTSEANLILNLTLLERGDRYVTENPQYEQTTRFAEALGCTVTEFQLVEEDQWRPNLEELKEKAVKGTRIVFLDNPNNPTGAVLSRAEMKAIVDVADDAGAWLHCDNALRGSELNGKPALTPYPSYERGVVTGSISKLGATSPRIGWIIGDPELIHRCWEMKDYTTLGHSGIGENIASALLRKRGQLMKRNLEISRSNLDTLGSWVKAHEDVFHWRRPDAGFTGFPGYRLNAGSEELCRRLLEDKGLLLSPGSYFGVDHHLRINTGSAPGVLEAGLERLAGFVEGLQ